LLDPRRLVTRTLNRIKAENEIPPASIN